MKKNLIPLIALVFGLIISSFTVKDCVEIFLVYNSGAQNNLSSYSTPTTSSQSPVAGDDVLVWIKVCVPNGTITQVMFSCIFEGLDTTNTSFDSLDDEPEKTITVTCTIQIDVQLEKGAS